MSHIRLRLAVALAALTTLAGAGDALAASPNLVISQVYGGGGNSGAPLTNDYVELYNRSDAAVPLNGLSIQYASATGTGNFGGTATQLTELPDVTLAGGQYFLVEQSGGANGVPLPTPDHVDPTPIAMAAGAGKVALVTGTATLGCNGSAGQPCGAAALARIIDLVGYGSANFFEGAGAAPALSATLAAFRAGDGAVDTDNNAADFTAAAPAPRNSGVVVDPPDTGPFGTCGDPATRVHSIQGNGAAAALTGPRIVEAVVVGDYQQTGGFNGYYLQEEDGQHDDDLQTSEGIFVFAGAAGAAVDVGDVVRLRGTAGEFSGLTQLSSLTDFVICPTEAAATATTVGLPVLSLSEHERVEGMLVRYAQTLTATEVFNLGRFGEVSLSGVGRLHSPTAVVAPGAAAIAKLTANNLSRIVLDDGDNRQNLDPTVYPFGGLTATDTLRVGDSLPNGLTGVMDFRFSAYRIQPVSLVDFAQTNPRPAAPASVGGDLKVASFNVLNYFNGDGMGGGFPTSRGAENPFEFGRQRAKIISALRIMNADVVGLMEIENDPTGNSAIEDLVAGLNAAMGAGTYAFVNTSRIGTDEIKVALIYKPAAVIPIGDWKIITSAVDPRFVDTLNRPSLAQTFMHTGSGQTLTVLVNHLKSKGSACAGDPDRGDGQGNCNLTRARAAAAIVDWLATDPTGSGDSDFLVIGDLNAYTFEDPIATLEAGGYTNLIRKHNGLGAYSYVFQGESGYLDHALATSSLEQQVTGVTEWHINPDEPSVLDYNTNFKSANHVSTLFDPGPYRSSDHDPVVVGVQLELTFTSLCALTRTYSGSTTVADSLCEMLAAAAAANDRGKEKHLNNYVNLVRAQAGKAFTAAQAEALIRLARTL